MLCVIIYIVCVCVKSVYISNSTRNCCVVEIAGFISLQSYFCYWYSITHSLFHSRLKSFLFSNPPYRSLSLVSFKIHYMDFPDCGVSALGYPSGQADPLDIGGQVSTSSATGIVVAEIHAEREQPPGSDDSSSTTSRQPSATARRSFNCIIYQLLLTADILNSS